MANELVFNVISNVNPATKALNKLAAAYDNVAVSAKNAGGVIAEANPGKSAGEFRSLGKEAKNAGKEASHAAGGFAKLASSIKRIAFYRLIRTAIKEVGQAFIEGTNNLVMYSKALENTDSAHASATMNEFATTALYLKNSLGAALMPILNSLVPIVNTIADAFVYAANAVNQFFHAIKGDTVFTKAKRKATEYGDALGGAAGAAKELKKQIFGFDELNIFNSPNSGGGGGGSGIDYSDMFEEAELTGIFQKIRDTVQENLGKDFVARLKINFKDILFNWKDLNAEQVAQKMLTGFFGLMGGIAGFAIGGVPGMIVGSLLGVGLGIYFSTIDFNGDGKLSASEVGKMLADVAGTITGAVVGFVVGGPGGALVGAIVGAGLTAIIKTFVPNAGITQAGATFIAALVGVMATALKHPGLVLSVAGSGAGAIGIAVTGGLVMTLVSLGKLRSELGDKSQFLGIAIAEILSLAAGGIIGFAFGGVAGAVIGITVAASLNVLINKVGANYTPESKRQLDQLGQAVDLSAMNNFLGSPASSNNTKNQAILKAEGRASGGTVSAGTYFYAGEAGPELIGTVGAKTNVTNQEQFTAGMVDIMDNTNSVIMQVGNALIQAIANKDMTVINNISGRAIVSAYDREKRLGGTGLVTGSGIV